MATFIPNTIDKAMQYLRGERGLISVMRELSLTEALATNGAIFVEGSIRVPFIETAKGDGSVAGRVGRVTDRTNIANRGTTITWKQFDVDQLWADALNISVFDENETGQMIVDLADEFMENNLVPATDLYRFTEMARGGSNILVPGLSETNIMYYVNSMRKELVNAEIPRSGAILYTHPDFFETLMNSNGINHMAIQGTWNGVIDTRVFQLHEFAVVEVPNERLPANTHAILIQPSCQLTAMVLQFSDFIHHSMIANSLASQIKIAVYHMSAVKDTRVAGVQRLTSSLTLPLPFADKVDGKVATITLEENKYATSIKENALKRLKKKEELKK